MKTYEMNWDCGGCGTKGLLGKTHRHCPVCGMPQDPDKRYFPPDDQKVAVEDHPFVGADKRCRACDAPVVATAAFCGVCGCPTDAAREAKRRDDVVTQDGAVVAAVNDAPAAPSGSSKTWWVLGAIAAVIVVVGVLASWSSEATATLTARTWSRTIGVQTYQLVEEAAWRDELPVGAYSKGCTQKERTTKDVPDGETCTTTKKDQGDGTFTERQECKPKFKKEPVMDAWCRYDAPKWVQTSEETAKGDADASPTWPSVAVTGCAALGCTREGARTEAYVLQVTGPDGKAQTCEVGEDVWSGLSEGQSVVVAYGLAGGLSCADIHAAP